VNPRIIVSAVCVYDAAGRLLTVRKRGTDKFMHPGGKPEPGETAVQAAARELQEEVGIIVDPRELTLMGVWLADAANEAAIRGPPQSPQVRVLAVNRVLVDYNFGDEP
jgi:8-oxo-dGTP diphosphatase